MLRGSSSGFTERQGKFTLERRQVFLTTLESSQSGLVAARPVSQQEFEERITAKFSSNAPSPAKVSSYKQLAHYFMMSILHADTLAIEPILGG